MAQARFSWLARRLLSIAETNRESKKDQPVDPG
jgi:hypothetical protein